MHPTACKSVTLIKVRNYWLNNITIICAAASFILEMIQIMETFKILSKLKKVFEKEKQD